MWIPQSEEELEAVVDGGVLEEGPTLDVKESLPSAGRSKDLAVDVAAMTSYGGVLIYGVAEDEHGRPGTLTPFALDGARERVEAIVRSSISEPPAIEVRSVPSGRGAGLGYLVVVVPPSTRAPHMVTVGGDNRFWARSGAGNVRLDEGEVAALYARRARWDAERRDLLQEARNRAPAQVEGGLHVIARPALASDQLLDESSLGQQLEAVVPELIGEVARRERFGGEEDWSATWRELRHASPYRRLQSRVWSSFGLHEALRSLVDADEREGHLSMFVELDIGESGSVRLWSGGAVLSQGSREELGVGPRYFEHLVAHRGTLTLVLAGLLYEAAGHVGPVDVGVGIDGLLGARSAVVSRRSHGLAGASADVPSFDGTSRVTVSRLAADGRGVMAELVRPLHELLSGGGYSSAANPFASA